MTDWFHATDGRSNRLHFDGIILRQQLFRQRAFRGTSAAAERSDAKTNARHSTRRMFVSTTAMRRRKRNDITALAV